MPAIYSCLVCGYRFTNKDCLVKCDGCSQRVHDKCSKLSMEELKYLSSRNRILKFFCESCEPDSSSIIELGQLNLQQSVNGFNKKNVITRRNSPKSIVINEVDPIHEDSDLHKINSSSKNPMSIFSEWYNEHMMANVAVTSAKAFSLATISNSGKVSCRSLILRRLDEDGFVMMTDGRSRKSKDLAENPQASMVFLWLGKTTDNLPQTRQVRIEGSVKKLSTENMKELYDVEPLFCKIRAQICEQGKSVEWEQLKRDHDQLFDKVVKKNVQLPKPDHVVAYKLMPNVIEFYESTGLKIADRLLFIKDGVAWKSEHLSA